MVSASVDNFVYIPLLSCQGIFIVRDIVEYHVLARCLLDRIFNGLESTLRVGRLSDTSKRMADQYLQISYVIVLSPSLYVQFDEERTRKLNFTDLCFPLKFPPEFPILINRSFGFFYSWIGISNIDRPSVLCVWITLRILISGCTIDI